MMLFVLMLAQFLITNCADVAKKEFLIVGERSFLEIDVESRNYSRLNIHVNTAPLALSFDPITKQVYWSDWTNHVIRTADLQGKRAEVVTRTTGRTDIFSILGMAVDYIHRLLYYTDRELNSINVVSLNNYDYRKTLLDTSIKEPRSIVILPEDGIMFWSHWVSHPVIEMAEMDGSNRQIFLSLPNTLMAVWLSIDNKAKMLYWADYTEHTIEVISLDKTYRKVVHRSLNAEYLNMAVMGNHIYVNDFKTKHIYRMTKTGEQMEMLSSAKFETSYDMYAYNESEIIQGENNCLNTACDHICLPKRNASFTCGCTNGYILSENNRSCVIDNSIIRLTPSLVPYTVIQGRQLELVCDENSARSSDGYTWRKNGDRIVGKWTSTYIIESADKTDDGKYICSYGGTPFAAFISVNVLYPPIVFLPSAVKVIENTSLSLTCNATANPESVSIKWTGPGGVDLDRNDTNETITIQSIQKDMSGDYKCSALNTMIAATVPSKPVTTRGSSCTFVDVLYGPVNNMTHESVNVTLNSDLRLICSAESNPQPSCFMWLDPAGNFVSTARDLIIRNVGTAHEGIYTCTANISLVPTNGDTVTTYFRKTVSVQIVDDVTGSKSTHEVQTSYIVGVVVVGLIVFILLTIVVVVALRSGCHRSTKKGKSLS